MAVEPFNLDPVIITVANTAVALSTGLTTVATDRAVTSVSIQADKDNDGDVYLGGPEVTTVNGICLGPGDNLDFTADMARNQSEEMLLSRIFVNSSQTGNKVRVIAFRRTP